MRRSSAALQLCLATGLDVVGKLTVPVALAALAYGHADVSIAVALVAGISSSVRALVQGSLIEDAIRRRCESIVDAARARSVTALGLRHEDEESVTVLLIAAHDSALFEATVVPHLVSGGIALVVLALAVAVRLGPFWLLFGVVSGAVLALALGFGQRRGRVAEETAFRGFARLARDLLVLLDAAAELRASDREGALAERMQECTRELARARRVASIWSALTGVLPASIAILSLAAPVRAGARFVVDTVGGEQAVEVGILGATAVAIAFGLARSIEAAVRAAPHRRALSHFLKPSLAGASAPSGGDKTIDPTDFETLVIGFEGVSHRHPGAPVDAPSAFDASWRRGRGMALLGENGSGKSTLALIALGLLHASRGAVRVGEHEIDEVDLGSLRRSIAYLPQTPFVLPGESIAWHLRLFLGAELSDARIDTALEEVGVADLLAERATKHGHQVRDVPLGELSGGERRRIGLARLLLEDAPAWLLDEPEAGLDAHGRALLRELLERKAKDKHVLVIAHDPSIVPDSFDRHTVRRGSASEGAPRVSSLVSDSGVVVG